MSTIKNDQILLYFSSNKIINGSGTSFQYPAVSQKHVRNVLRTALSSTEIYLSLLLITFAPKSFWILFHRPNVLKLHLNDKLQATLAYYLCDKRDFSYCQIL